jgi:CheY-like chemotaxis protein
MTALRVLHVDDEPDIRKVVRLSLSLDPTFAVLSCGSGAEALAAAPDWSPDMILCDVVMPMMDGPATLKRLQACPKTVDIPVVFMTARVQRREMQKFKSLGAVGVIAKPFDPMTLVGELRAYLRSGSLGVARSRFVQRLRADAAILADCRTG